jgi:phage tail sheath protein FI
VTQANLVTAINLFNNAEKVDISLLFAGDCGVGANAAVDTATVANQYLTVASARKDCVAFVSPALANVVGTQASASAVVNYRNALTSTSYGVMDSGWKYQYDKYSDVYRWVPLNADIAGLCVRTDLQRDPWFSPAGLNRGQIRNLVKLGLNPTQSERDTLYKSGVNPVVSFPGEGTVLFGDKTLQGRPSAFDRINVRRLFIVLEKAISSAARSSLFEFNDEFTRAQFVALVEPFLRDVQGRRGIFDFRVVCDETNNTAGVIDRNEFVGDIYVKPARSVNFIQLNFVAVRSGVAFDEIVGRF